MLRIRTSELQIVGKRCIHYGWTNSTGATWLPRKSSWRCDDMETWDGCQCVRRALCCCSHSLAANPVCSETTTTERPRSEEGLWWSEKLLAIYVTEWQERRGRYSRGEREGGGLCGGSPICRGLEPANSILWSITLARMNQFLYNLGLDLWLYRRYSRIIHFSQLLSNTSVLTRVSIVWSQNSSGI